MINWTSVLFALLAVVILLNLMASVCLMRSNNYSILQTTLQLILVWVFPLVGATGVLIVWAYDRKSASRDPVHPGEVHGYPELVLSVTPVTRPKVSVTAARMMGIAAMSDNVGWQLIQRYRWLRCRNSQDIDGGVP